MKKSLLLLILLVLVSTGIITAQQVDSVHVKKTVQTLETIDFKLSYFDGLKREVLPLYFMKQEEASYESIQLFDSWGRCVFFLLIEEESIELKIAEIR